MKYYKKPVVIEAVKWDGFSFSEKPDWIVDALKSFTIIIRILDSQLLVATPEGAHIARAGDYIIRGVKGELYPCKPDIFEQTYERVVPVPAGSAGS